MRKIILVLTIILFACNQKKNFTTVKIKCVVDSIYEAQKSTIEFDKRYVIITDCGEYQLTTNNLRIKEGDTVTFSNIVKTEK